MAKSLPKFRRAKMPKRKSRLKIDIKEMKPALDAAMKASFQRILDRSRAGSVVIPAGTMKVGDKVTIQAKLRGKSVISSHVITRVADGVAIGVPEYMERGAQTYRDRQKQYGDNYKNYGTMMQGLFPNGLTISSREDWNRLGIIHNCVTKLGRYCNNIHTGHQDSAHDLGVYAFMLRELTP